MVDGSRIIGHARSLDADIKSVKSVDQLCQLAEQDSPKCVFLDLQLPEMDIADTVDRLRDLAGDSVKIIAFGPHVAVNVLRTAREAGCDEVLPRSQFFGDLPENLRAWFA